MFKDSRKDILIHDITKDLDFLLLAHVGATGDESPRDFVNVAVTAN
jgi:hypothetical protein